MRAADRVAVVEDGDAVRGADPRDLGRERGMVGGWNAAVRARDLGGVGLRAVAPDRRAVEVGHRAEAGGVLARVEAGVVRAAVGVDQVAVEGRADRGDAGQQAGVELVDVPVGVGERPAGLVQARGDLVAAARCRVCGRPRMTGASPPVTSTGVMPRAPGRRRPTRRASAPSRTRRGGGLEVGGEDSGPRRAAARPRAAGRARRRAAGLVGEGRAELDPLRGAERLDAEDALEVRDHRRQAAGAVGRHRDVVLLVGGGRGRVGRAGGGEVLVLAHQRRGRDLGDHEAGVQAGVRRSGTAAGRRTASGRPSAPPGAGRWRRSRRPPAR